MLHTLAFLDRPGVAHLIGFIAVVGLFFCMPLWIGAVMRAIKSTLKLFWWPIPTAHRALRGGGTAGGGILRTRRRAACYAVLGEYLPQLVASGASEPYYRALVETGIKPAKLRAQLERHLAESQRETVREELRREMVEGEVAKQLTELAAAHKVLIAEAEVEKEILRHQAQAVAGVVDRLRDRYLPDEEPEEDTE